MDQTAQDRNTLRENLNRLTPPMMGNITLSTGILYLRLQD
jgi:hypothetical protein